MDISFNESKISQKRSHKTVEFDFCLEDLVGNDEEEEFNVDIKPTAIYVIPSLDRIVTNNTVDIHIINYPQPISLYRTSKKKEDLLALKK